MSKADNPGGKPAAVPESAALARLRDGIDDVDRQLAALLDERMALVLAVGQTKREADSQTSMRRIEREEEVFAKVAAASSALTEPEIRKIYREIISCYMAREEQQRVAYLGPPGTFSQQAVLQSFGGSAATLTCATIGDLVRAVESDRAQHGVVPLENSSRGIVDDSLDLLADSDLTWGGEILVAVHHCLLGQEGEDWRRADKIYGHPQAFAQCREWLQQHLPAVPCEPALSNGLAAEKAAQEPGALAIAPAVAADLHALRIVHRDIQDARNNTTRFVIVGKRRVPPTPGPDKTSLLVATEDKPGALLELLQILHRHQVNMSMLYSRPSGIKNWSYSFFLDVAGHRDQPPLTQALAELQQRKCLLRVFGSYPTAATTD